MRNILKLLIFCIVALLGCNEKKDNYNPIKEGISQSLEEWLAKPIEEREPLESLDFSKESLTQSQAENVTTLFFQDRQATSLNEHGQQWSDRVLYYNGHIMPFYYQIFGNKPPEGCTQTDENKYWSFVPELPMPELTDYGKKIALGI